MLWPPDREARPTNTDYLLRGDDEISDGFRNVLAGKVLNDT